MTFKTTWPWPFAETTMVSVKLPAPLHRDRRIFTRDGQPWCWQGLSAFPLCDRFSRGDTIDPFLEAFSADALLRAWRAKWPTTTPPELSSGYNLLRVWD